MPFRPDLLRELREAKGLSQEQLSRNADLSQSVIAKSEKGKNRPGSNVLEKLARALDCTIDYLHGRGKKYESPTIAAADMALDVFLAGEVLTDERSDKCYRALRHPDAPKTAQAWRSFAEMLDLAIAPVSSNTSLALIGEQRPKSKPMAVARRRHS